MAQFGKSGLVKILNAFAEEYFDKTEIVQSQWPEQLDDILYSLTERRKCGLNLTLQLIYAAYVDLLEYKAEASPIRKAKIWPQSRDRVDTTEVDITRDASFVPETMDIIGKDLKDNEATCKVVPETQMPHIVADVVSEDELFKTPEQRVRLNARKKSPTHQKFKDVADKYSPLTCLTSEKKNESTLSIGALGTGSMANLTIVRPTQTLAQDSDSPSMIKKISTHRKSRPSLDSNVKPADIDTDDEDFKDLPPIRAKVAPITTPPKKKKKLSKQDDDVTVLNKFGLSVTATTASQKKRNDRLKQQGIMKYTVSGPEGTKLLSRKHDDELELAKTLSLETKRLEDASRKFEPEEDSVKKMSPKKQLNKKRTEPRTPLKKLLLDESLDRLPSTSDKGDDPGYKFVSSPVRKKKERKLLPAFECHDCQKFYAAANLDENQLQELLQQCSRHRSKNPPPPASPQNIWKLDLVEDSSQNKTQIGSPLKTRRTKRKSKKRRPTKSSDSDDAANDSPNI